MSGGLRLRRGPGGPEVVASDGAVLAALLPNDFETRFFGRRLGILETAPAAWAPLASDEAAEAASLAGEAADAEGYSLVQARVDVRSIPLARALETAGFRLADTRVEFLTRLDRRRAPRRLPPFGEAGLAVPADRPALLALVHEALTDNPEFQSRYKDPAYFTPDETVRWFTAWMERDFSDPATLMGVWRVDGEPVAYFGYAPLAARAGVPHYKCTLAAVSPRYRGHKAHIFLQTTLFDAMPADEFWVSNVSQLGNVSVIRNDLGLGRWLDRLLLTFFRRVSA